MSAGKRFYKLAAATADLGVALDGRPVKTPGKHALVLPTAALAEAVAAEWQAQGETLLPSTMFLTKLANTAIDRVHTRRPEIIAEMVEFAGSDLVCYRADRPPGLVALQKAAWDPVLAWSRLALDAGFQTVTGVVHVAQPPEALAIVERHFAGLDSFRLTALHNIMTLTGSALLAAMLGVGAIAAEACWAAAHVDEDYQIAQWGADDEAARRRTTRHREFADCARFLSLLAG
jgi:chaperone required for assembly of F1-ATPase